MAFSRERRAHLARKWHYIEGLSITEIQERLEERGIASLARSTISSYLNEESAEETKRLVRERQADEDLRMAEAHQRKHDRAREDEMRATEDQSVKAVRPRSDRNLNDHPIRVPDWRVLEDDEQPPRAEEEDVYIEGTSSTRTIPPGGPYYALDPEGNPEYKTVLVGVERDQPDLAQRSSLRYEQDSHLDKKATRLGIDDDTLTVEHEGSLDVEHSVPEELIEAVVGAAHHRLDENVSKDREDDQDQQQDDDPET